MTLGRDKLAYIILEENLIDKLRKLVEGIVTPTELTVLLYTILKRGANRDKYKIKKEAMMLLWRHY